MTKLPFEAVARTLDEHGYESDRRLKLNNMLSKCCDDEQFESPIDGKLTCVYCGKEALEAEELKAESVITFSAGGKPTAKFMTNGEVWMLDETTQELRKIDVNKELAQCFAYLIAKLGGGMNIEKTIAGIKKAAVEEYIESQKVI